MVISSLDFRVPYGGVASMLGDTRIFIYLYRYVIIDKEAIIILLLKIFEYAVLIFYTTKEMSYINCDYLVDNNICLINPHICLITKH